jgi:hypothetical protein
VTSRRRATLARAALARATPGRCKASGPLPKARAQSIAEDPLRADPPFEAPVPLGAGRRVGACARPLLPGIAGTRVAPSPAAAAGRGPGLPARCLPQGVAPGGGPPGGAASRLSAGADPLFREGGACLCQQCDLYIQNPSRPSAGRWAQRRGIRPHAAGLRALVRGRAAGEYVAALLPLLGQAGRHLLPWTHGRVGTAWGERRLEGQGCPGIHQEPARLDMAQ